MEPEGLSPCSQELATCPYPEPNESNPHPQTLFPKIHLNVILPSTPRSSQWSPPFIFHNEFKWITLGTRVTGDKLLMYGIETWMMKGKKKLKVDSKQVEWDLQVLW
jgi:hypothetical protein